MAGISGEGKLEPSIQQSLKLLLDGRAEARATVRAYDTKAQIVGIGYIFALEVVTRFEKWFPDDFETSLVEHVLVGWGIVILPILLFGYVLYPSRKMASKLTDESTATLENILYVDPKKFGSVYDQCTSYQSTAAVSRFGSSEQLLDSPDPNEIFIEKFR